VNAHSIRILFVNHTGIASGAELALMRLVDGVRAHHSVAVACPEEGSLAALVDAAGVRRFRVPAFEASLRLHPLYTPLGLARLAAGSAALADVTRRFEPDVVHANTPRAGLMSLVSSHLVGAPLVVRAHEALPPSRVGRMVRGILARSSSAVVTVSRDTAQRFNDGLERPVATHVYNSFDRSRFDPERVPPAEIRAELGLPPEARLLGQIGQITPWKGQDTSIRMLRLLRDSGVNAHLLIVGRVAFGGKAVRYDNHAFLRRLHELVDELRLGHSVHILGERRDVPEILGALDLSLLPSWDEPFANVMLESMAMGVPLLVTEIGGGPELVEDGVNGRLLPPRRPELWAAATAELLGDRSALERMGDRARLATARFDDAAHAREMLGVYERVLGRPVDGAVEEAPRFERTTETPVEALASSVLP
jgi:glycosyltransferase involved in cell wall biosynthesis